MRRLQAPVTCRARRTSPEYLLEMRVQVPQLRAKSFCVFRARLRNGRRGACDIRTEGPDERAAICPAMTKARTRVRDIDRETTHLRGPTCGTFCHEAAA